MQTPMAYDSIFLPDQMLPSQHRDQHTTVQRSPERRLLLELLEGAIKDLKHKNANIRAEAHLWIAGADAHFNFVDVCDWLDIDSKSLRKRLLREEPPTLPRNLPRGNFYHTIEIKKWRKR